LAFWNSDRLKQECSRQGLINPYDPERVKHSAYELGVGDEAFITSKADDTTHLKEGTKVTIPPGQFGLLISKEVVFVPHNAIAFISIRARIKFQGLVNVSGFHVDPGFRGQLKFAVYNAGSKDIILDQAEPVFMIWYADLDAPTPDPYDKKQQASNIITSEDLSKLKGEVASPAELKKRMEEINTDLEKKIHAVEQSKLYNRSLIMVLLTAVVALFFTTFIRPYFDRSATTPVAVTPVDKESKAPDKDSKSSDKESKPTEKESKPAEKESGAASEGERVLVMPAHLGWYVLGSGAIAGLCVIIAALFLKRRGSS
jgi:dCTP deaminase